MSIAFRKVWRDLWNHKGRTLLVALSIAVGVMALGMTTASDALIKRQMRLAREASHKPHARLTLVTPIGDDVVDAIASLPEVADADGAASATIRWKPTPDAEWKDASLLAVADYERQKFDWLELKTSAWPKADEIAAEINQAAFYEVPPIGEVLYVQVNDNAVPLRVSGLLRDPLQLVPPYSPINQAAFYVNRDTLERILGTRNFNQLRFAVPHYSRENVEAALSAVEKKLKRLGALTVSDTLSSDLIDPQGEQTQDFLDGISLVLTVMAIFSLALSVTLVINTINAVIAQQVTQIGIMKTVGGLYPQIVTLYLSGVAVYGFLSLALAVPIGAVSGYYLSRFWLVALNVPVASFEILTNVFLYQLGVGLIVPFAAALWPILRGVSISVREAIAAYGLGRGRYGVARLDRLMGRVQGLPRMATLALRNTFRRAGRAALTQITLISAGAIFMMVVTTGASFNRTFEDIWAGWGFDVLFVFRDFYRIEKVQAFAAAHPDVEFVEMWTWVQAKAHKPDLTAPADQHVIQLRGAPDDTRIFNPKLIAGRLLDQADGHALVLNQQVAREIGVAVGDTLVLELGAGRAVTGQVVGLVFDIGVGGQQNTAFMRRTVLNADLHQAGRATTAIVGVRQDTFEAQEAIKQYLLDYFKAQGIRVTFSVGQIENRRLAGVLWGLIGGLLQLMTFLVAVVGGIGLSGTLSINVMERRREIGVMRAVGASSGDVAFIFMGEGLLLGLLSWAQAVPLSLLGARYFVEALGQALNFPFFYSYSWTGTWIWLGIIVALALAASWFPARRATQISVRESLAYE